MPLKLNSTLFLLLFFGMYEQFLAVIQQILQKLSALSLTRQEPQVITQPITVQPPRTPQITRPSGYYFRYYRQTQVVPRTTAIPTIMSIQNYKRQYLAQVMRRQRIFRPVSRVAI